MGSRAYRIRAATLAEAALLSSLAIRSKAHWGYDDAQMRTFRDELTLRPGDVREGDAHVVEVDGIVRGFYTLTRTGDVSIELEHLFIDPDALGGGLGAALLAHARHRAAGAGFTRMTVQSDPNAAGFYESMGARKLRDIPSSIPGRTLPCYEIDLA